MRSRRVARLALVAPLLAGTLPAQDTGSLVTGLQDPGSADPRSRTLISIHAHDEETSRALFASADRNADDRLDILEAGGALQAVDGTADRPGFRRLDEDRSGYLSWPEFDAHLRAVLETHGTFYFFATRSPAVPGPVADAGRRPAPSPRPRLMALLDQDGDDSLSRAEVAALLARAGLPAELIEQFPLLDRDRSGSLSAAEAQALSALIPDTLLQSVPAPQLPAPYRAADADGDGALGPEELAICLERLAPGLGVWADRVLRDADRDQSGTLDAAELSRAGIR